MLILNTPDYTRPSMRLITPMAHTRTHTHTHADTHTQHITHHESHTTYHTQHSTDHVYTEMDPRHTCAPHITHHVYTEMGGEEEGERSVRTILCCHFVN